jgi:hypothetical protein
MRVEVVRKREREREREGGDIVDDDSSSSLI